MFIPNSILMNYPPLKTVKDCVEMLDREVSKHYPNMEVHNVPQAKLICFNLLKCFFEAGKLDFRLTPDELELAVIDYLDEHLWVNRLEVKNASVARSLDPQEWFKTQTLLELITDLFKYHTGMFIITFQTYKAAMVVFYALIVRNYKFLKNKVFKSNKVLDQPYKVCYTNNRSFYDNGYKNIKNS